VAVGFDLDMTLVDSRAVSRRALERLTIEHDHELEIDALMAQYGLPPARWLPRGTDLALFRRLQLQELSLTAPMPGARAALATVHRLGERAVVVTAASENAAAQMLSAAGLTADGLHANVWAEDKSAPLREEGCWAFVGDHPDDMAAAHRADAVAVGVTTGTVFPAGADVVLTGLHGLPAWLAVAS
jgi:phosphoglycolate phosphatase